MTRTDAEIIRLVKRGVAVGEVAKQVRRTRAWCYMVCQRENVVPADFRPPKPAPPPRPPRPVAPQRVFPTTPPAYKAGARAADNTGLRRFKSAAIEPDRVFGLQPDHPAVVEGRTLFPSTVVDPADSPRLFVSGKNNPKLGDHITKGTRRGWPIYHLTLEERATCPRTCPVWNDCYGNSIHRARRHRHNADLIPMMKAELRMLAEHHPAGFMVRLHTLGDFYSVAYVKAWADMLDELPALHCFGFTARSTSDLDVESRRIALAVAYLCDAAWDRFAIRWSGDKIQPQGSLVVDVDPHRPEVAIVCPAQTEATTACATCQLCWSPAARQKTILFLRHGMKRPGARLPVEEAVAKPTASDGLEASKHPRQRRGRKPKPSQRPWGQWEGTAAESLQTTAEERLAAVPDDVKAEIEAKYGARFKA